MVYKYLLLHSYRNIIEKLIIPVHQKSTHGHNEVISSLLSCLLCSIDLLYLFIFSDLFIYLFLPGCISVRGRQLSWNWSYKQL